MLLAIHINSTAPFKIKNKRRRYCIEDFDILSTVLSALMWRKMNGTIKLYTDKTGYKYYKSLGILDLWDGGVDTTVVENIPASINQEIFWAAAKLFALQNESVPVTMIDTDLIVWKNIEKELDAKKFAVLHREMLSPHVYIPEKFLKKRKYYRFDPAWDWMEDPCNMALAYFADADFKKYYLDCAIDFMTDNKEYPKEMVSQMVFAEQRIVSMCAKQMEISIFHFLDDPYQAGNNSFTHIWGGKDIARNDPRQRAILCSALLQKIKIHFPEYYEKLQGIELLKK
jgi:hypothetical protein